MPDTSSIDFAICGAAPMPAELIHRFEARYGIPIVEGYGLSECTCAATINPIDGPRKPGTVGLPLPGVDVAVLGDRRQTDHAAAAARSSCAAPTSCAATSTGPRRPPRRSQDGWLHTGDVGHFDDDGYLVLVDRVKDMIIRGGENIYPKEIENVLYGHPAVLEAAVVGRPHDRARRGAGRVRRAPKTRRPSVDDELRRALRRGARRLQTPASDRRRRRSSRRTRSARSRSRPCERCSRVFRNPSRRARLVELPPSASVVTWQELAFELARVAAAGRRTCDDDRFFSRL